MPRIDGWIGSRIKSLVGGLVLLLALAACAGGGDDAAGPAPPGTRVITIVYSTTHERFSGAYVRDGRYDAAAMAKITTLFRDRATGETHPIDPKLIDVIYNLLSALALPETTPVELTSGYRTPGHQAELALHDDNAARRSLHTTGQAADLKIPGVSGRAIGEMAKTLQDGGVAYYPKTGHTHVDTGAIRTWVPH